LVQISQRIKKVLKKNDLFIRMGGDEFIIVINDLEKREDTIVVAEKILSLVRDPMNVKNYHLHTTASIGIAIYPDDGTDRAEILKHADSAMYDAKEKGKDNYQFYTKKLSIDIKTRLNLEQELLQALERGELSLCYQPQYELASGKIIGAEALLRWNNPNLGVISPDSFIPIAEETGVIVKIGYYVFEEACRTYMYWAEKGVDIQRIAINLSSVQLQQENIYEQLMNIIHKVGISPSNIEIEITERLIMDNSSQNLLIFESLRKEGCKISIDDFGTGYSSMSYMKSFPLDTIKIDKSFITDLPDDTHDAEVSKAIIALSKSLGYEVIAEGIETLEQEKFLIAHHCDIGQGYYFAKPMTRQNFISFYQQKKK
jgi:predicted signal transduction protein with EAL and GGDEF domain